MFWREGEGAEQVVEEGGGFVGEGGEYGLVLVGVVIGEGGDGVGDGSGHDGGATVVEGMGEGEVRVDPLEAEVFEGEGAEEGGGGREGVDGGADIVGEAGEGEVGIAAHAAAGGIAGFDEKGGAVFLGQGDGGGEAVGAGADDDGVVFGGARGIGEFVGGHGNEGVSWEAGIKVKRGQRGDGNFFGVVEFGKSVDID